MRTLVIVLTALVFAGLAGCSGAKRPDPLQDRDISFVTKKEAAFKELLADYGKTPAADTIVDMYKIAMEVDSKAIKGRERLQQTVQKLPEKPGDREYDLARTVYDHAADTACNMLSTVAGLHARTGDKSVAKLIYGDIITSYGGRTYSGCVRSARSALLDLDK